MDLALALIRFIHAATLLTVFGGLFFTRAIASDDGLATRITDRLGTVWRLAAVAAALTSVAWLLLAAAMAGNGLMDAFSPGMLATVALETGFGRIWSVHIGACCLLAASLHLRIAHDTSRSFVLCAGFAALLSLAATGHAMMPDGIAEAASIASQAVHLVAAGYWLGSLPAVCLTIPALEGSSHAAAIATLRRFSRVGHGAVALVVATGVSNLWFVSDGHQTELAAPYATLLLAKVFVVAIMIVLAIANRYVVVPRLRRDPAAMARLYGLTVAIFALGLAALGLVSVFGMLSPT